ncbi:type VI secretion system tip protein VgrG [Aquimarina gracilis]|uniref:Type VI secretion system tip protein VgrG n=1 Tax=Aquimarina gracilis TaxID=874422 RepID=A0ABU5ZPM7_9FLAO|nr:type VI secretion system tip protein VgrG [Aquimarina gracilis]MEB3344053.1 type VI secretion system tip protein VgrG [Aquimarina gracilis]
MASTAVTNTIKSNGKILPLGSYELMSIDTTKEFNKIPMAELKLSDGCVANQKFETLESDAFIPGALIEIFMRYEGRNTNEQKIFEGVVINQEIERSQFQSILTIELWDPCIKMTSLRKNKVYQNHADSKIIKDLIGTYNDLKAQKIESTSFTHPQMVQYYVSDWDFMVSRAEANGQLVLADNGEISVFTPQIGSTDHTLTFGIDLAHFDLKISSRHQYEKVQAFGLDTKKDQLALSIPKKGKEQVLNSIDYKTSQLSDAVGAKEAKLVHAVPTDPEELQSWSDAQLIKSRLSLVQGTIRINGNGKIKVGQTLKIENVSRFNGEHIITGVRHGFVMGSGWYTYIQIGMDANWFSTKSDIIATQAAGLLPGVNGLQIGTVLGHVEDADHGFRLQVHIPAFHQEGKPVEVLAMYTSLDAGVDHGIFFPPEKGDRVVVGFLNDDPRQAIVLGAMHSNKVPHTVKEKKTYKGIFTKSNYQLLFDEEKETVTLSTTDANQTNEQLLTLNQKEKIITLKDAHGNSIEMGKDGIKMLSTKDFSIDATGDFSINSKGKVKIKGKKVDLI